jgi:hypothetical protein
MGYNINEVLNQIQTLSFSAAFVIFIIIIVLAVMYKASYPDFTEINREFSSIVSNSSNSQTSSLNYMIYICILFFSLCGGTYIVAYFSEKKFHLDILNKLKTISFGGMLALSFIMLVLIILYKASIPSIDQIQTEYNSINGSQTSATTSALKFTLFISTMFLLLFLSSGGISFSINYSLNETAAIFGKPTSANGQHNPKQSKQSKRGKK